jgi:opacity protein-like surface antigen
MSIRTYATAFALIATLAAPLAAQDQRLQFIGYGGFNAPLADLQQTWYPDGSGNLLYRQFKSGINAGAGVTYWLDQNLGVRLDGSYVTSKVVSPESNASWSKIHIGGDIVLRAGSGSGISPYGYLGLGQVRMSESGTSRKANRAVARFGTGLAIGRAGAPLGFFGEAALLIYDFDQTIFPFFDKVQTDLALRAGLSFAVN